MSTSTRDVSLTQVYRVYIRATPEQVWDAITRPEWTERYFYGSRADYELRPGGAYRGFCVVDGREQDLVDGEVLEADPPRRLVQTWRVLYDPALTGEGFTRLTWELQGGESGVTALTVVHEMEDAPGVARNVGGDAGGWSWVLSGLKTLLETGTPLPAVGG